MAQYQIGDLISFQYPAVHRQGTRAHDKVPSVLVLHPLWGANLHGLNFNYLSNDEINMLRMLIDPAFQLKYAENLLRKNPNLIREFDRIIAQASNAGITSPRDFYMRIVRPVIITRGWDPYRRYSPSKMTNVRIVQRAATITGEQARWEFGTNALRDRKGKKEKDIVRDLARKDSGQLETGERFTQTERQFISRLQGRALTLFRNYKRKFQASRGPRTPTFGRG